PNDIMAGDKKLGGILIENIFLGDNIRSVIGIGVNVNQTQFDDLPNATSLAVIAQAEFEITTLLEQIVENIKYRLSDLNNNAIQTLAEYNQHLFRRGETTLFRSQAQTFSASIIGVGMDGLLQIEKVDGTTAKFNLKEVEMMY